VLSTTPISRAADRSAPMRLNTTLATISLAAVPPPSAPPAPIVPCPPTTATPVPSPTITALPVFAPTTFSSLAALSSSSFAITIPAAAAAPSIAHAHKRRNTWHTAFRRHQVQEFELPPCVPLHQHHVASPHEHALRGARLLDGKSTDQIAGR